jgi:flagellar hook-basal body complex protein FliE
MKIDTLDNVSGSLTGPSGGTGSDASAGKPGFGEVIEQVLEDVNNRLVTSGEMAEEMAAGKPVDIAQVMIAGTKAGIAFNMTMQVRNKVLSAYEEIMRMQV